MNSTHRSLSIAALLAVPCLAFGQAHDGLAQAADGPVQPLNLSLPRSDVPLVRWEPEQTRSTSQDTEMRSLSDDKSVGRRIGRLPYGSGFEARQGSSSGGRGMGRGR